MDKSKLIDCLTVVLKDLNNQKDKSQSLLNERKKSDIPLFDLVRLTVNYERDNSELIGFLKALDIVNRM